MATKGKPFPEGLTYEHLDKSARIGQIGVEISPCINRSSTTCAALSPDGEYLAWSSGTKTVHLLSWKRHATETLIKAEVDRRPPTKDINCGDHVQSLAFGASSGEKRQNVAPSNWFRFKVLPGVVLATGHKSGTIRIWNPTKGDLIYTLLDHKGVIRDLDFSPDGSMLLLSASLDGSAKVWDLHDDGNMGKTIKGTHKMAFACGWSPNMAYMCVTADTRQVSLYEGKKPYRLARKLEGHIHDVISCAFSRDGALLATGSCDTTVILWDPYTGAILNKYGHMFPTPSPIFAGGHNGASIKHLCFTSHDQHLVSAAEDRYLRVWDIFDSSLPVSVAEIGDTTACTYSPETNLIIAGNSSGVVTFHTVPIVVPSLQHLCRLSVRRLTKSQHVKSLGLPTFLAQYLLYARC